MVNLDRQWKHISRGGRAFMPLSRMRHIKREEDVARSALRREGYISDNGSRIEFEHWDCSCGSIECLGNPRAVGARRPRKR